MEILRQSNWKFKTSGSEGVSFDFLAFGKGTLVLTNPRKNDIRFSYLAMGAGLSVQPGKLARLLRLNALLEWAGPGLSKVARTIHLPQATHHLEDAWEWTDSHARDIAGDIYNSATGKYLRNRLPDVHAIVSKLHLPNFLPKIEISSQLKKLRPGIAPETFWNTGNLWMTQAFRGEELAASDIAGICIFFEGALAFGKGGTGTIMALGCHDEPLSVFRVVAEAVPIVGIEMQLYRTLETAKAVVFYIGEDAGFVDLSGTVYVGVLR